MCSGLHLRSHLAVRDISSADYERPKIYWPSFQAGTLLSKSMTLTQIHMKSWTLGYSEVRGFWIWRTKVDIFPSWPQGPWNELFVFLLNYICNISLTRDILARWDLYYDAREAYSPSIGGWPTTSSLNPAFWHKVTEAFETNESSFQVYETLRQRGLDPVQCDAECKRVAICDMRAARVENACVCYFLLFRAVHWSPSVCFKTWVEFQKAVGRLRWRQRTRACWWMRKF